MQHEDATVSAEEPATPQWGPIEKTTGAVAANMQSYETLCRNFSWERLRGELFERADDRMNIASLAIDRPAALNPHKLAVRFIDARYGAYDLTYGALLRQANRFAILLQQSGVGRGDAVATLLGRCPELFVTVLGTLKAGCVFSPLFSAFGPEPIRSRLELSGASVLVTTQRLYERKVALIRQQLPQLRHVLLICDDREAPLPPRTLNLETALAQQSDVFSTVSMNPEDAALLHFTSGTTGKPKGVVHAHRAVIAHYASARLALDLHDEDVFWCTADPGWVTGISYGVIAPLTCDVTILVDREELDVDRWYTLLEQQQVTVWYTAPTAVRMLMRAGGALAQEHDLSALRLIASVGEPLNPEAVWWGMDAFGMPIHDNWWQTETGGIIVANTAAMDVKPGSMGKPLPGVEAGIVNGELVLRPGWPSMFRGYLDQEERYRKCFRDGWYFTGDLAKRDADGYYWFVGRADDVIKSAGHLIGPFEVESALMEHPAVAEAGVIGKPDPVLGERVKAFVSLRTGFVPGEDLKSQILAHARRRLGAAVAPKEIDFAASLPRTRSGKIMRRLLKARELGLPEGDTSTLESTAEAAR